MKLRRGGTWKLSSVDGRRKGIQPTHSIYICIYTTSRGDDKNTNGNNGSDNDQEQARKENDVY